MFVMKWLLIIGLIVGGWGIWYVSTNVGLEQTNTVMAVCSKSQGDTSIWASCAADAWGNHELRQNLAIGAIVIGALMAIAGGAAFAKDKKQPKDNLADSK